jgi:hypothetical protein
MIFKMSSLPPLRKLMEGPLEKKIKMTSRFYLLMTTATTWMLIPRTFRLKGSTRYNPHLSPPLPESSAAPLFFNVLHNRFPSVNLHAALRYQHFRARYLVQVINPVKVSRYAGMNYEHVFDALIMHSSIMWFMSCHLMMMWPISIMLTRDGTSMPITFRRKQGLV